MDGGEGWLGGAPHTCAHARTCTRMHVKHDNFMQMAAPIGGILGIPYDVICACACVHVFACACVGGTLSPPPPQSTHPPGGTPGISQNSIALELIEIFQFRLKI